MQKRWLMLVAAAAVLLVSGVPTKAQVGDAPWCAVVSNGTGSVYWDCQYWSVEACVPNVLAGNRGFCNHNPRFVGYPERPRMTHRHKRHHRHR
jgi:hypothetical protein